MADAVLVVGGAGYIGSHAVKQLARRGFAPVTYDNLVYGHRDAVTAGAFEHGDLGDAHRLGEVFRRHRVAAVMHFGAYAYVGESVTDPARYWRNNVAAPLALLDAMRAHGVDKLIFSSTCATYGEPEELPIPETHPQRPINPYGATKLALERVLADYGRAYGLRSIVFRYFNAAGADPDGDIGERHDPETHLVPLVLEAVRTGVPVRVFGDDYPTPDGTCVRDYIHVTDLAEAHVLGLERLLAGAAGGAYNLGNGAGYSVKEVLQAVESVTGRKVPWTLAPRREGDPARLVGSSEKARRELGWAPRYPRLEQIVETAWAYHRRRHGL
jgi:UDP-glucose-4-epimerase GalE